MNSALIERALGGWWFFKCPRCRQRVPLAGLVPSAICPNCDTRASLMAPPPPRTKGQHERLSAPES